MPDVVMDIITTIERMEKATNRVTSKVVAALSWRPPPWREALCLVVCFAIITVLCVVVVGSCVILRPIGWLLEWEAEIEKGRR